MEEKLLRMIGKICDEEIGADELDLNLYESGLMDSLAMVELLIAIEDEFGALTMNNGIIGMKDGQVFATLDSRYPVTYTPEQIRELATPHLEDENGVVEILNIGKPLFFPPDSDMVKKLVSAYVDVTGDTEHQPEVIGGGTYAKAIPGIIAFGCEFPGADNHIHDANESLPVEELSLQATIYQKAIENLLA